MTTTALALDGRDFSPNSFNTILRMMAAAVSVMLTAATLHLLTFQKNFHIPRYAPGIFRLAPLLPPRATVDESPRPALDDESGLSPAALMGRWEPIIAEASARFSVPEAWIRAVMRVESGGRTTLDGQPITSSAGAAGLMQLMQKTYDEMREQHALGSDVYDPHDNIFAGAAYLQVLKRRYGYPYLFAAYNAGPKRVEDHLTRGASLPAETRTYLQNVVKFIGETTRTARTKPSSKKPQMLASTS